LLQQPQQAFGNDVAFFDSNHADQGIAQTQNHAEKGGGSGDADGGQHAEEEHLAIFVDNRKMLGKQLNKAGFAAHRNLSSVAELFTDFDEIRGGLYKKTAGLSVGGKWPERGWLAAK
jgi:hypothetical protein